MTGSLFYEYSAQADSESGASVILMGKDDYIKTGLRRHVEKEMSDTVRFTARSFGWVDGVLGMVVGSARRKGGGGQPFVALVPSVCVPA